MAEFYEIAGYRVLATLGQGARSTIYAVRDRQDRVFALKRVVRRGPSDQRFLDQALCEHDIASRFDHEHLRRSHKLLKQRNFLRTSEVLVLMELVDGSTLEQHHPRDIERLIAIGRQVAAGLGAMHEAGFVHADIKPNNIMIGASDEVKIIDFGQSCAVGTVKERIQGTPDYIAPEQVRRGAITPRTDVFNLGATLYWLLTRRHVPTLIPKGKKPGATALLTDEPCPPPIEINPDVPPALSSLIVECIHTDPAHRPGNMTRVADRLEIAQVQFARKQGAEARG